MSEDGRTAGEHDDDGERRLRDGRSDVERCRTDWNAAADAADEDVNPTVDLMDERKRRDKANAIDEQLDLKTTRFMPYAAGRIAYTAAFGWFVSSLPDAEQGRKVFSWRGTLARTAILLAWLIVNTVVQMRYGIAHADIARLQFWPVQLTGAAGDSDTFQASVTPLAAFILMFVAFGAVILMPVFSSRAALLNTMIWLSMFCVGCFNGSLLAAAWLETRYIDSGRLPYGSYLGQSWGVEERADYMLLVPSAAVALCLIAVSVATKMLARAAKGQAHEGYAKVVRGIANVVAAIVYMVLMFANSNVDAYGSAGNKASLLPFLGILVVFSILPGDINAVDVAIANDKDARWQWLAAFWLLLECEAVMAITTLTVLGV